MMTTPASLEDNGFLYMLTTIAVEFALIGALVWTVRLLVSRVMAADQLNQAVNTWEAFWLECPEPAQRLRNHMLRVRGVRLPPDPDKVAQFQQVIRVNGLKRRITL